MLLCLLLLRVGTAHAAWLPPVELTANSSLTSDPVAAAGAAGDIAAAYLSDGQVWLTEHPAGASWSAPLSVGDSAGPLALAENGSGHQVLAWESPSDDIDAVTPWPGEPLSQVTSTLYDGGWSPSAAIDGFGDAVAVFQTADGLWSDYQPAGRQWMQAVPIDSRAVTSVPPAVSYNAAGAATLVWVTQGATGEQVVSAESDGQGQWGSPVPLTSDTYQSVTSVQVALDAAGDAAADWIASSTSGSVLGVANRTQGGSWQPGLQVPVSTTVPPAADLAVNAAGTAAVIWTSEAESTDSVNASVFTPGDGWSDAQPLGAVLSPAEIEDPSVAVSPDGTVTADWAGEGGNESLMAAQLPPGGGWAAATRLVGPIESTAGTATVAGPAGEAVVLSALSNGESTPLWATADDAVGPTLDDLRVPATGTVGVPVLFSVAPGDLWSELTGTTWDFGDRQSLAGETLSPTGDEAVSHTYTAPGTYTVTATAVDALGNAATESSTIVISAAAPTPRTVDHPLTLRVNESHRRWREPAHRSALSESLRRVPVGTRFEITVSDAARVTLRFDRLLPGRRNHGRCVVPSAENRADRPCTRASTRGAVRRRFAAAGRHTLRFSGRVGARRLAPGRYAVVVSATGSHGAATRTLRFTVV